MRLRSLWKSNLGLALASTVVSVLVFVAAYEGWEHAMYARWKAKLDAEGWLGKVTVPSPNPVLMWEYRPYGEFERIRTNRHGFRDRDHETPRKPPGTRRVAFIGDSVTLGWKVAEEETFVRRFEADPGPGRAPGPLQALNFSVDGYSTPQIQELLRTKVLAFEPDEVLYTLCLNDFDFDASSGNKTLYFRKPASFLYANLKKLHRNWRGRDFHAVVFAHNKDVVFGQLREMNSLLRERGIGFRVLAMPTFPAGADYSQYGLTRIHEAIGAFLQEERIWHLDLLDAFRARNAPPRSLAFDIWHPNPEGHALVAAALRAALAPPAAR